MNNQRLRLQRPRSERLRLRRVRLAALLRTARLFIVALSAAAVSADTAAAEDKPPAAFRFVALLHLTGDFAAEGKAFQEGIELAAEKGKAALAAAGKTVELTFEDTGYDAAKTSTAAAKYVSDASVSGFFVSTLHEIKPIAAGLEKAHLPTIVLWDSSPEIEDLGDYIFGIGPWTPDAGRKAADFAEKTLKAKTVFVISTNNEWSNAVSKAFFAQTLKNSADMLGTNSMNPEDRDFLTIVSRVRKAGPDAVYAPLASNLVTFAKQVRAGGIVQPIITSDVITQQLLKDSPQLFEGFYQTLTADPEGPASQAMKAAYVAKYGKEPANHVLTALGYDGMTLFLHALQSGSATREAIKDELAKARDVEGAYGPITMNEKGSAPKFVSMFRVKGGKFELVEKADGTSAR